MSEVESRVIEERVEEFNMELVKEERIEQTGYLAIKRIVDIVVSIVGLAITAPIMLLATIAIKLESPGPIIFKQTRLGKNGQEFTIYKFRSMVKNAEKNTGAVWAKKNDARVTNVGRFIRKTRIDELPQFINILKGEMTLVGPRPERPSLTDEFHQQYPGFKNRLLVTPGVTGLAQIKGGYDITPGQKYRLDKLYIKRRNLLLDIEIMFRTALVMIIGDGAR
ncbi:exopolysaccharide biosynthesis polyprenyl glycosylphosphotransferase [Halobacteroides halobius DSM 5150]|uniref:Exopolysaccharide biosynthesis polyprenyl glycosylphosphotransferase n=1 Tax=Halobacteroides halobius (strain ATCC 35273 / DSM 5150 / MD-1) TaxID=748449 RepID=L0KDV8_HALHC|nr:exopolysaccharide biosynthesis polyprenyl glycosylphosphotransferase [Halobacteroides halobius]AGB42263.1 exopolysaccharide biosynthesis polyprenyl glycosylphosphotransferase [Halobacteroides halobius DSM 5150]